jgi:ethanolamine ammonia-lyase large subunit
MNKAYNLLESKLLRFLIDELVATISKVMRNCDLAVALNKFRQSLNQSMFILALSHR